jgi:hypothetical protein
MLIAANYTFNSAPRDGTVIGHWSGPLILQHMMGNPAVLFEGRKFGWLGMPTSDALVCILTERSGIKTAEEWRDIRIAAETGELDGTCAFGWQSAKVTWANALRAKQVHVVLQTMMAPHPELKGVPLAVDYAKTDEGKKLLRIASELYGKQRLYSLPPQVPEQRVRTLQKAFIGNVVV